MGVKRPNRRIAAISAWIRSCDVDIADAVFFLGVFLIAIGLGGRPGVIAAGAMLVLSVRPLWGWIKRDEGK